MPRLFAVVTHSQADPQRRAWIVDIKRRLAGIPTEIVVDRWNEGMWGNCRRAWKTAYRLPAGSHLLVLADDMMPVPNFAALLGAAVASRPDDVIGLFAMREAIADAQKAGMSWVDSPDGAWGGSIVVPRDLILEFLGWERANIRADYPWDDRRLLMFLAVKHDRPKVMLTSPCLVEHVGAATSLVGNANRTRVARLLASGAYIDWNTDAFKTSGSFSPSAEFVKARRW